ncbi:Sensors of blue-light using FAD [Curtobacterium sp. 9128]|uniref:BLUF domain-containing protein n=1 Tax=Curtobacterium sp. 9128 TaxID=1793722 RepID=UPI0007D712B2|nr:BLUF domain-containing protein [Curtobacterium sp. 9128]SBN61166.1 Sensors of blue-light using FAD [Curtobacterium sp. 9128]
MRSIVYTSTQTRPITDTELAQILAVGREKNTALGVTGILAHKGDNCLGILEGDDATVAARFEQVRRDPRHTNVRVLADESVAQRSFPDWSMAFQPLDPLMEHVPGFSDLFAPGQQLDPAIGLTRARGLLEWFRKHPLAPLTSQTAEADEVPRTRAINGAISALHGGSITRFTLDDAAERAGMSVAEVREVFPTERALLAATVERWTQAISAPLAPLMGEQGTVAFLHALLATHAEGRRSRGETEDDRGGRGDEGRDDAGRGHHEGPLTGLLADLGEGAAHRRAADTTHQSGVGRRGKHGVGSDERGHGALQL